MTRISNAVARQAIFANETDEIFLELLRIGTNPIIHLVNNFEDVTSNGDTYTAYPFKTTPPHQKDGEMPTITLTIDAVDQTLVAAIRLAPIGTVEIQHEMILASDPDTVIVGPWIYELKTVRGNRQTIELVMQYEPIAYLPWPQGRFTPTDFPSMFAAVKP